MQVIRDEKKGIYTLVPVEAGEQEVLSRIAEVLTPGDMMCYVGRERDWISDTSWFEVLHFGAGDTKFTLRGSSIDDNHEIDNLYWACVRAYEGLVFLGEIGVKGKKALVVTGGYCKLCGRAMINFHGGWKKQYIVYICESCSVNCEHRWEWKDVEDAQMTIACWLRCELCGRSHDEIERLKQALSRVGGGR